MKSYKILISLLTFILISCSSENEVHEQMKSESNSNKQRYVESCSDHLDRSRCSCQFDVMDPILTKSIGEDWSIAGMKEENYGKYLAAVEATVQKCK